MSLFKISGILETMSTISLFFIAMPLKYIGGNEILVKVIGPIHGFLFILYCALVWWEPVSYTHLTLPTSDLV